MASVSETVRAARIQVSGRRTAGRATQPERAVAERRRLERVSRLGVPVTAIIPTRRKLTREERRELGIAGGGGGDAGGGLG